MEPKSTSDALIPLDTDHFSTSTGNITLRTKTSLLLFVAAIILSSFAATMPQAKASDEKHKPCLMLYEEYRYDFLKQAYERRYGKEYDPKDTVFFYNPYKVMIDTCPPITDGTWGGYDYYATHYFPMKFERNIIPRKEIYEDNRLIYYTWEDILDEYKECKEGFRKVEEKFGKFRFVDRWTMRPDTSVYVGKDGTVEYKRELSIQFDEYVSIDSYSMDAPQKFIRSIKGVNSIWWEWGLSGQWGMTSIEQPIYDRYDHLAVYPNTADREITITLSEQDIMFPKEISIYDNVGKLVKIFHTNLERDQDINISDLPNGYYLIKIGNSIGKFIIRR